jgi:hypothetical protein
MKTIKFKDWVKEATVKADNLWTQDYWREMQKRFTAYLIYLPTKIKNENN